MVYGHDWSLPGNTGMPSTPEAEMEAPSRAAPSHSSGDGTDQDMLETLRLYIASCGEFQCRVERIIHTEMSRNSTCAKHLLLNMYMLVGQGAALVRVGA